MTEEAQKHDEQQLDVTVCPQPNQHFPSLDLTENTNQLTPALGLSLLHHDSIQRHPALYLGQKTVASHITLFFCFPVASHAKFFPHIPESACIEPDYFSVTQVDLGGDIWRCICPGYTSGISYFSKETDEIERHNLLLSYAAGSIHHSACLSC